MRAFFLFTLCVFTLHSKGQKLDFALSAGTGKVYIVESLEQSINVNYGLPLSLMGELKFTPLHKNWGIKLRIQQVQSAITGEDWVNKTPLNGYVNTTSFYLLLENELIRKKYSYGFNFGLGITKETIQAQKHDNNTITKSNFASITTGAHLTYKLGRDLDFQILPVLLCQDPFKSLAYLFGGNEGKLAGEDIAALINFGIRYRINGQ